MALENIVQFSEKEVDKLWLNNREKKRLFKSGLYWCGGCDANLVGDWKKCEVCNRRNGIKRNKKVA